MSTTTTLHETKIDLSAHIRGTVIDLLNSSLADLTDLKSQTKHAHWNVRGHHFYTLHLLFDKLAEELDTYVDDVAERITALGGTAHGTIRQAAKTSTLPEFPAELNSDLEFVSVLAQRFAAVGSTVRANIDRTSELEDQGTADLFTSISRDLDKNTWFLEAHSRK